MKPSKLSPGGYCQARNCLLSWTTSSFLLPVNVWSLTTAAFAPLLARTAFGPDRFWPAPVLAQTLAQESIFVVFFFVFHVFSNLLFFLSSFFFFGLNCFTMSLNISNKKSHFFGLLGGYPFDAFSFFFFFFFFFFRGSKSDFFRASIASRFLCFFCPKPPSPPTTLRAKFHSFLSLSGVFFGLPGVIV